MNFIAKLGQSIQFVAFCAHFFAGGFFVLVFPRQAVWIALGITVGAAIKEFWFDAKYETDPPQTFTDNLEDFLGWILGAWIAYGVTL